MKIVAVLAALLCCIAAVNSQPLGDSSLATMGQCSGGQVQISPLTASSCLYATCVVTNDSVLQEASSTGCHAATCSEATPSPNQGRGNSAAISPSLHGGRGTCELSSGSMTVFFCNNADKIIVTVDAQGYSTFNSINSIGHRPPTAYYASRLEHGGCYQPLLSGNSRIPNDKLYIDCSGKQTKKCPGQ